MLLERLTSYARENRSAVPAFHRDREFRWKLDIRTNLAPTLQPLRDQDRPKRGVVHTVPASTRTVGISPNLAADDAQYVLGWGDDSTDESRVADCHSAFVALIDDWAAEVPAEQDRIPHLLADLYRSGALAALARPEEVRAKDGVVIAVDGRYAYRSPSAAEFWRTRVGLTKGSGRSGVCMVCRRLAPLANTIPGKVPATLVPGASNDTALVSINERVFGYDLAPQLTHTPICLTCADDVMVGLTGVLSSDHALTYSGQDTRVAWWVAETDEPDRMQLMLEPDPAEVDAFFESVHQARERTQRLHGRFCWLAVGGNVARIMVREWLDIALTSKDDGVVNHDTNILAWFTDHKNTPRRTQPLRRRDGTEIPAGKWVHSPTALAACLGRWDENSKRYRPFGAKNADRPDHALHQLLRVAVLNEPLPVAMRSHLIHRIRSDSRIDDHRAALVRLALSRNPHRPKDDTVPMSLDETCTDPAYIAGRLFAALEDTQRAAHRKPKSEPDSSTEPDQEAAGDVARREVNSTFGDRFLRRAVDTPRPVLVQGRKEAAAWLTKIRRRDSSRRAGWYKNRLTELYDLLEQAGGVPMRNNLRQQEQFILGYHHQLAHRTIPTSTATDQA
ncbi:type I-C CRISPR-associated protein Cas8c/Csd1 [Nocardia beijingensis]|uniref:type I-C CRISPR-associated protein Cas8c/Csd1 n=1 Tax=Nocardia beijingensis TaxID=95162 RepID=UPI0033E9DA75